MVGRYLGKNHMLLNFSIFLLKLEQATLHETFNYKVLVPKPLKCVIIDI